MTIRLTVVALLTILACCDGGGACGVLECDDDGRCWASVGWPMRPEAIEAATLDDALEVMLEPMGGDCYAVDGTDSHVCTIDLGCALLLGRPADEVILGAECAPLGPWAVSGEAGGQCWVVLGAVAVVVVPP